MNSYELVTAITALDVLGSIFVQLGETLETIALQRELEENRRVPPAGRPDVSE